MRRLIAIVGPTGSGKTSVSIKLAQQMNGAVISADSRQVYIGMDIGTAKSTWAYINVVEPRRIRSTEYMMPEIIDGIDHYLLNIRDAAEPMSLADWQVAAFEVIDQVLRQKQTPLLVGGTMLYVDSIVRNYALPQVPPNSEWREIKERMKTSELYKELIKMDPAAGEFVQRDNKRRIIRALEVIAATRQPFSTQRRQHPPKYEVKMVGIFPGWDKLRLQVTQRTEKMLDNGLLDEVQQLRVIYGKELPLLQTINYKQAGQILDNKITQNEGMAEMTRATMQYARRQMSWWKGREEISWFDQKQITKIISYCTD